MANHVASMEKGRSVYILLTGKAIGKRPLRSPRCGWEDNIRMYLKELGTTMRSWVDSAQDRDYWRIM